MVESHRGVGGGCFLDVLREEWDTPGTVEEAPVTYLEALHQKLQATAQLAQEEQGRAQEEPKQ